MQMLLRTFESAASPSKLSRPANDTAMQPGRPADPLTPRELEVLVLIAGGKTSREIACQLGISFKTAVSHRTRIMDKLDTHRLANLVRYAIRAGIVKA